MMLESVERHLITRTSHVEFNNDERCLLEIWHPRIVYEALFCGSTKPLNCGCCLRIG